MNRYLETTPVIALTQILFLRTFWDDQEMTRDDQTSLAPGSGLGFCYWYLTYPLRLWSYTWSSWQWFLGMNNVGYTDRPIGLALLETSWKYWQTCGTLLTQSLAPILVLPTKKSYAYSTSALPNWVGIVVRYCLNLKKIYIVKCSIAVMQTAES